MIRTANPALRPELFAPVSTFERSATMTVQGTAMKVGVLLLCCIATASFTWAQVLQGSASARAWMIGGLIGGLVFALVTIFKPTASPITAPLYAGCEGLFLGGISAFFESAYQGIVLQAVGLTFGVLALLVVLYMSGMVRVTGKFRAGVAAATGAIFLLYLVSWIMSMFGAHIPFIHQGGPIGIGFSVFVVVIASLNLMLDFDFIERGAQGGAAKHMEWYGAFGLMVTLVWLYIEILRLLSKLKER